MSGYDLNRGHPIGTKTMFATVQGERNYPTCAQMRKRLNNNGALMFCNNT